SSANLLRKRRPISASQSRSRSSVRAMATWISRRSLVSASNSTKTQSHTTGPKRKPMTNKYRYEEFTWPEIREAVAQNRVAVLPVGTIEQHGPHLPLVGAVIEAP